MENLLIFVEVWEKSWNFFGKWQKSWNVKVKLPILTMGTTCVIALSLDCYIMSEIDILRGFDPGKVMKSMRKIPV